MEITRNGQNLLDIAIQATGDAEAALVLALANGLCLTDDLEVGQTIDVPDDIAGDVNIRTYYQANDLHPATGVTQENEKEASYEGIEYWGIEYDFEIS